MKNILICTALLLLSYNSFALTPLSKKKVKSEETSLIVGSHKVFSKKEKVLGNIVKSYLEQYHFSNKKINDDLSKKAFGQYLKKIDYGKQFLLKSDVRELEVYRYEMDDQMTSANHKLLNKTTSLMVNRIKLIADYRKTVFKKNFDFSKKEDLELDPDKRSFSRSANQLKDHWRKVFKQSTLTRYISLIEDQEEEVKNKNKPKDKKSKKLKKGKKGKKGKKRKPYVMLSDKEMIKKSHESISKKYDKFFARLLKEDRTDYLEKFINSISTVFDPHTSYLPPKKKEDFDIDIKGSLEGIGAVLSEDGQYIKVVTVVPGGAAWRQKGLEVDDIILYVGQGDEEPVDLVDMRVDDAVRYIRGKKGTEVRLTVKKADGSRKVVPIIRDVVQIGESFAKSSVLQLKGQNTKVGYIHLPKFYRDFQNADVKNCTEDVRQELRRVKKQNVDAVILDLRNNGGGALEDAKQMSGLFIKEGPIVQIKSHTGSIDVLKDVDPRVEYGGPLIVMINRFSASASEILAGAMQDYGRAIIVGGEYSHGKGTVQAVLNLNQGPLMEMFGGKMGALKLTIQKFYRITGASTQYKGVTPNIIFPDPYGYTENREQDLDYSLKWDQVPSQVYAALNVKDLMIPLLKKRSEKRIKKDARFKKIIKSTEYLVKRRKQTKVSLNLKVVRKEDADNKKMAKTLEMKDKTKNLLITNFEASLLAHQKINKGDKKHWKKDFDKRKKEWVDQLRLDPALEETMYIIEDLLKSQKGKKLSMVN